MEEKVRRGDYRNYYKGHRDKTKEEGGTKGGRWAWLGWGEVIFLNRKFSLEITVPVIFFQMENF